MLEQSTIELANQTPLSSPSPSEASTRTTVLDEVVDEVARLGTYRQVPAADGLHLAIALSHRLQLSIADLRAAGWSREAVIGRLAPARAVHAESPFIHRLQVWPRGYPGDFETIEWLMQQQNRAEPGRFSYWLEQYALDSALAQQHRNKADLQARTILEAILAPDPPVAEPRVLILAAGGSPDLRQIQSLLARRPFRAVLLDQDADALAFSLRCLPDIADRLTPVHRNVIRGLPDVRGWGPYHLVLAGGLFDYLPDKVARMVLRYAREHLLVDGGRMVFTNIADSNLYRPWMEHMAEWMLIHRSEAEMRRLCAEAGYPDAHVAIGLERTGLTYIAHCHTAPATGGGR
ncbi:MAG: hypothetical protein AB7H96_23140 [Vicinamibacterales bacterium]